MQFFMYSPVAFEPWDWRNSVEKGIGGSETSTVENAWRLTRRGHSVTSYAPIPYDCPGVWRGTTWLPLERADFSQPGVWILYRCPEVVDKFDLTRIDQVRWLIMQDWNYAGRWTPERIKGLDRIVPLCKSHNNMLLKAHPELWDRLWISSNGIKVDLIDTVETWALANDWKRDPKRVMYASSPDRGMLSALKVFKKAKEIDPELSLHLYYGFNNIDKMVKQNPNHHFAKLKETCLALAEEVGAVFHGRISQFELYKEWFRAGIWLYITNFYETSCITCQEAQAMGAIPIFSPIFAQAENTQHGVAIDGSPDDPLTVCRAAEAVVRVASSPAGQENMRQEMMPWARAHFDWENFVTQWIHAAEIDLHKQVVQVKKPKISVLTPSIRLSGLPMVLASLEGQDYEDWEWLVGVPENMYQATCHLLSTSFCWKKIRVLIEPNDPKDFYQLNKTWNHLIKNAAGELVVFTVDWTTFPAHTLSRLFSYYTINPKACINGFGHQYDAIVDGQPVNQVWQDPRLQILKPIEDMPWLAKTEPWAFEFTLASIPRRALLEVGGADETYDATAGMSEKELCMRIQAALRYDFFIDTALEYRSFQHGKHMPPDCWDKHFTDAMVKFTDDIAAMNLGRRNPRLKYLRCLDV